MKSTVDTVIEQIVDGVERTAREKYLLRQSLHNLVRLVKTEQLLEIKASVRKLTGKLPVCNHGRKPKLDYLLCDMDTMPLRQQQFEFDQYEEKSMHSAPARRKCRD